MEVRKACVAGQFYAGTRDALERQIEVCYDLRLPVVNEKGPRRILAAIAPHAGYMYSGRVAATLYRELAEDGVFETAILIGPNHSGLGADAAVMVEGEWETPLGRVEIESDLALQICRAGLEADDLAHLYEHCIEVQLPFLQKLYPRLKIVPICLKAQDVQTSRRVGEIVSRSMGERDIVVATTDFTHYEPQEEALRKDRLAIEAIIDLDEEKLFHRVQDLHISMCGYGPAMAAIVASRERGAKEAALLTYTTSAEFTGDYSVVGYGAVVIRR